MDKDATNWEASLGATWLGEGRCRFLVWAPFVERVEVCLTAPEERKIPLKHSPAGYHEGILEGLNPEARYCYQLDGNVRRADPASHHQPEGVFGPSAIAPGAFPWQDRDWFGLHQRDYVFYELHVGAFTAEGTFDAIIPRLPELQALGITALELMPVAEFPGTRNWGYDGIFPFAVEHTYGGPAGLKRLVNACHQHHLAVTLDVVYNHIGPEGNYFRDFGPYFTERYRTPWGPALNFDGPESDEVRRFFLENALYWISEFHVDALRLDSVHAIMDQSARPFLQELTAMVEERADLLNRRVHLVAESDLNDVRMIQPRASGGCGFDAQWNDGFHHSLHTLLTGEHDGYYRDFGQLRHLAKAYTDGFVYSGEYSLFRRRRYGNSARDAPAQSLVVCAQNHDQVGNRAHGERLSRLVDFESLKLAAGAVLLSPFVPLLFMGEEYGEAAPFLYFTSHSGEELAAAVRNGRREEFAEFAWLEDVPDPQDESSFLRSKLQPEVRKSVRGQLLYEFYRELLTLRKGHPALAHLDREHLEVLPFEKHRILYIRRRYGPKEAILILSFADSVTAVDLPVPSGLWRKLLDSSAERWQGPGERASAELASDGQACVELSPRSLAVYEQSTDLP